MKPKMAKSGRYHEKEEVKICGKKRWEERELAKWEKNQSSYFNQDM